MVQQLRASQRQSVPGGLAHQAELAGRQDSATLAIQPSFLMECFLQLLSEAGLQDASLTAGLQEAPAPA